MLVVHSTDLKGQEYFSLSFDIPILGAVFSSFWCPLCRYGHIVFEEDENSKKGFASSCAEVYVKRV